WDVGDIDRDSLIDLVGPNFERANDSTFNVVTTQESPNYTSYPRNLSWWHRYAYREVQSAPFYFTPDLDNDNKQEILFHAEGPAITFIFENIANNQNYLAFYDTSAWAWSYAFGDFDLDNKKEFVTAWLGSLGRVFIYENTTDNQYELVIVDTVRLPNGSDVFSGNDLDGDGKPEFFVGFARIVGGNVWDFFLYMWESIANNTYQRTFIDQIRSVYWDQKRSKCGDIDGDGIDELVWSIGSRVMVYKAIGNNQFQRIWEWYNDHGGQSPMAVVNIYDMNKNGYNEIIISGYGKTSIFEVEAVKLLRPNWYETFHGNTQELISWRTIYPPNCDSLSLFYSIDNGRTYTTIVTGIPSSETSYVWTVPNVNSDSCKIKVIAYGPGWQYDESDDIFRIITTGIEEIASPLLAMTLRVKVYPNPAKSLSVIRYSLPVEEKVTIQLYNISGRLIKTLIDEYKQPGNYKLTLDTKPLSAGVYLLTLKTDGKRIIERMVVVK
ncbi:MAG: T9SS type A sorting domain-containing protein, partial [candidate division WOR-3 bacterium]